MLGPPIFKGLIMGDPSVARIRNSIFVSLERIARRAIVAASTGADHEGLGEKGSKTWIVAGGRT